MLTFFVLGIYSLLQIDAIIWTFLSKILRTKHKKVVETFLWLRIIPSKKRLLVNYSNIEHPIVISRAFFQQKRIPHHTYIETKFNSAINRLNKISYSSHHKLLPKVHCNLTKKNLLCHITMK